MVSPPNMFKLVHITNNNRQPIKLISCIYCNMVIHSENCFGIFSLIKKKTIGTYILKYFRKLEYKVKAHIWRKWPLKWDGDFAIHDFCARDLVIYFWLSQTLLEVKFLTQVIMLQIYPVSNHFFWQSKRHVFKTMCNAQSEDWMNPEKKKK